MKGKHLQATMTRLFLRLRYLVVVHELWNFRKKNYPPFKIAFMWYPFVQDLIRKSIWFLKINACLLMFVVLLSPYFRTSLLLFFWYRYQLFLFLCYIIVGRFDIWLKRLGIWHCLGPWLCWLGIQIQGVCL